MRISDYEALGLDAIFNFVCPDPSNNHFKSGKVYHGDGTATEWRNYAIIKTDDREFKAPIMEPKP